uniref:Uncharacterized protein n=1 Tax=Oryza meridionalis TaxID=40149 RepID=A0A0E0F926_9ORYZ
MAMTEEDVPAAKKMKRRTTTEDDHEEVLLAYRPRKEDGKKRKKVVKRLGEGGGGEAAVVDGDRADHQRQVKELFLRGNQSLKEGAMSMRKDQELIRSLFEAKGYVDVLDEVSDDDDEMEPL